MQSYAVKWEEFENCISKAMRLGEELGNMPKEEADKLCLNPEGFKAIAKLLSENGAE